jgi:hypothetical protein
MTVSKSVVRYEKKRYESLGMSRLTIAAEGVVSEHECWAG